MNKEQYLVPYLMSSHPGSTLKEAVELALFLKDNGICPEQVQDFYPTPGTISTCMFYTELDPYTMQKIYVPKTSKEKAMQRALLQYFKMGMPVEAKLFIDARERNFIGDFDAPYPLIDVATFPAINTSVDTYNKVNELEIPFNGSTHQIGRASCRERVLRFV